MFIIAPYYDAEFDQSEEVNDSEMWLTVNEDGQYVVHFWKEGELIEQLVDTEAVSVAEEEMGVSKQ